MKLGSELYTESFDESCKESVARSLKLSEVRCFPNSQSNRDHPITLTEIINVVKLCVLMITYLLVKMHGITGELIKCGCKFVCTMLACYYHI